MFPVNIIYIVLILVDFDNNQFHNDYKQIDQSAIDLFQVDTDNKQLIQLYLKMYHLDMDYIQKDLSERRDNQLGIKCSSIDQIDFEMFQCHTIDRRQTKRIKQSNYIPSNQIDERHLCELIKIRPINKLSTISNWPAYIVVKLLYYWNSLVNILNMLQFVCQH